MGEYIGNYSNDDNVQALDRVLGTDVTGNTTKNFTIQSIVDFVTATGNSVVNTGAKISVTETLTKDFLEVINEDPVGFTVGVSQIRYIEVADSDSNYKSTYVILKINQTESVTYGLNGATLEATDVLLLNEAEVAQISYNFISPLQESNGDVSISLTNIARLNELNIFEQFTTFNDNVTLSSGVRLVLLGDPVADNQVGNRLYNDGRYKGTSDVDGLSDVLGEGNDAGAVKITNIANGTAAQDAAAFGQIPVPTSFTGETELSLDNPATNHYNWTGTKNYTVFTTTNETIGCKTSTLINTASQPSVTGGFVRGIGDAWVLNTDMEMVTEVLGNGIVYYHFLAI